MKVEEKGKQAITDKAKGK